MLGTFVSLKFYIYIYIQIPRAVVTDAPLHHNRCSFFTPWDNNSLDDLFACKSNFSSLSLQRTPTPYINKKRSVWRDENNKYVQLSHKCISKHILQSLSSKMKRLTPFLTLIQTYIGLLSVKEGRRGWNVCFVLFARLFNAILESEMMYNKQQTAIKRCRVSEWV